MISAPENPAEPAHVFLDDGGPPPAATPHRRLVPRTMLDEKRLWQYESPSQFVRSLMGIVEMIAAMGRHGVVHGNISTTNTLIGDGSSQCAPVLLDLDSGSACLNCPTKGFAYTMERLLFAAAKEFGTDVNYCDTHFDLETLAWVARYSLLRKAHETAKDLPYDDMGRMNVRHDLDEEFGPLLFASEIAQQRLWPFHDTSGSGSAYGRKRTKSCLENKLQDMLPALMWMVKAQENPKWLKDADDMKEFEKYLSREIVESVRASNFETPVFMSCDAFKEMLRQYASEYALL